MRKTVQISTVKKYEWTLLQNIFLCVTKWETGKWVSKLFDRSDGRIGQNKQNAKEGRNHRKRFDKILNTEDKGEDKPRVVKVKRRKNDFVWSVQIQKQSFKILHLEKRNVYGGLFGQRRNHKVWTFVQQR